MHIKTLQPNTLNKTLDETIKLLTTHSEVEAIITLGTTASGMLTPDSDYDILLILKGHSSDFSVEISIIDNRTADILLASVHLVEGLLTRDVAVLSPNELAVARWLSNGNIVFDRGQLASSAQVTCREKMLKHKPSESFLADRAQHLNYDLRVNQTYAKSQNPLYLQALRLRELHSFSGLFVGYFILRGLPWEGEKKAIQYIRESDPEFSKLVTAWLDEIDLKERMDIYSRVAAIVLEPVGGIWPKGQVFEYDSVWEHLTA